MKVAEPATPGAAAVNVFTPAVAPSVQLPTVAIPDSLVVCEAPVTDPPPVATENVTVTNCRVGAAVNIMALAAAGGFDGTVQMPALGEHVSDAGDGDAIGLLDRLVVTIEADLRR